MSRRYLNLPLENYALAIAGAFFYNKSSSRCGWRSLPLIAVTPFGNENGKGWVMVTILGYTDSEWRIVVEWCKLKGYELRRKGSVPLSADSRTSYEVIHDWLMNDSYDLMLKAKYLFQSEHDNEAPQEHHLVFVGLD